jgi:hypothetical protein
LSCLTTSSLSKWQVTDSGFIFDAISKAAISARYSDWLFVAIPTYWVFVVMVCPASVWITYAIAAGPGFPLAPPSE